MLYTRLKFLTDFICATQPVGAGDETTSRAKIPLRSGHSFLMGTNKGDMTNRLLCLFIFLSP